MRGVHIHMRYPYINRMCLCANNKSTRVYCATVIKLDFFLLQDEFHIFCKVCVTNITWASILNWRRRKQNPILCWDTRYFLRAKSYDFQGQSKSTCLYSQEIPNWELELNNKLVTWCAYLSSCSVNNGNQALQNIL